MRQRQDSPSPPDGSTRDDPGRYESVGSWFETHPMVINSVVVLAVFSYNLPIQFASVPEGLWPGIGLIFSCGLCLPYLGRHTRPLLVFVIIFIVVATHLAVGVGLLIADIMLLFALYTLSSRFRWNVSAPATLAVIVILIFATAAPVRAQYMTVGDVGVLIVITVWTCTWGALVRIRRSHIDSLRQRAIQLEREAEVQQQIIAAEERARIAREIHDVVSHSLSVVSVMSDGAVSTVDSDPQKSKHAMETVRDTGRSALSEMRSMLGVLRSGEPAQHAPQPGVAQLDQLIEESKQAGLPVTFTHHGQHQPLPDGLSLTIYRTVQESLTNVRKHACPPLTGVCVEIEQTTTTVDVRITDDGHTRPDAATRLENGHGLVGMHERINAYGGTLHTGHRKPHGFEIHAKLPIGGAP